MHIRSRLLLSMLAAVSSSVLPFVAAHAQNAIGNQAYAQMNQVQQDLQAGLITPAQANDLMARYNDVLNKSQQWTAQDGGRLNTPDRLDLQGKLKKNNKRLLSSLQNNGVLTGGVASTFLGGNGIAALNPLYGSTGVNPLYGNAGIANGLMGANNLASSPYGMNAYANSGYGGGGGCHHHRNFGNYGSYNGNLPYSGVSSMAPVVAGLSNNGLGGLVGNGLGGLVNNGLGGYGSAYGGQLGLSNASYSGMPYGQGTGLVQGLLGQARSRLGYGSW